MQAMNSTWRKSVINGVAEPLGSWWRLVMTLFKLRIVALLLLAAYGGFALQSLGGQGGSFGDLLLLTLSGLLSASGASAINQYLERERDATMNRTAARPLPAGLIARPEFVLWLGLGLVVGATLLAGWFNRPLAWWVLAGAFIYVGVYTIWLKPRTVINIVIGGAAGSCAVLSGGAAAGNWASPGVLILALLLFAWTPAHFWSLALAYRDDYARAAYPMLPALITPPAAARWTALHVLTTVWAGLALGLWPHLDLYYLAPVGLASIAFVWCTWQLLFRPERKQALSLFHFSNLYLTLVLFVTMLATLWR